MRRGMHASPMCWKTFRTLVIFPPATRTAMESKKLPAKILIVGIGGGLFQVRILCLQVGLLHVVLTTTAVPTCRVSYRGLWDLHEWQKLNSSWSCVQKTMNLGSVLKEDRSTTQSTSCSMLLLHTKERMSMMLSYPWSQGATSVVQCAFAMK